MIFSFRKSHPRLPPTLQLHLSGRRSGLRHARGAVPVVVVRSAACSRSSGSGSSTSSSRRSSAGSGASNSSGGSSSRAGRRAGSRGRRNLAVVARASNTRDSDIVSIDLESEVLQSVGVANSLVGVGLSESQDAGVLVCAAVVLDDALTDLGDVEQAVQKVRGPVEVGGAVGDVVAEHAHALQRTAEDVGAVADHRLGRGVGSAPVAGPVC